MKYVNVVKVKTPIYKTYCSINYAIQYSINSPDKDLISSIDSIIYDGQCEYFGIKVSLPKGFRFNVLNACTCTVEMHNMPEREVRKIANKVADLLGVILNLTMYRYS